MKRIATTFAPAAFAACAALAAACSAHAEPGSPGGGYDYASKFYPHPAGLYLLAEQPRERFQHPAVVIWREAHARQPQETMAQAATKFYMHPAGLALSAAAPAETSDTVRLARR